MCSRRVLLSCVVRGVPSPFVWCCLIIAVGCVLMDVRCLLSSNSCRLSFVVRCSLVDVDCVLALSDVHVRFVGLSLMLLLVACRFFVVFWLVVVCYLLCAVQYLLL